MTRAVCRSVAHRWWLAATIAVLTVVVFAPVGGFDFVGLDDPRSVTENPQVLAGLSWRSVWWALTTGHAPYWHPLTWLSHMLDVQLFGLVAGGHHLTNLAFHVANTLLLCALLRRLTGAAGRSAVVSALFAVHPLHVESVAWIAERKDVLSTCLWLLTMWAYVSYARAPRVRQYAVVASLFALGLMAKPMVVTLPFTLLLVDVWPLGRLQSVRFVQLAIEKLPLLALSVASAIATFVVELRVGAVSRLEALPLKFRLANALTSYAGYIVKAAWPIGLSVCYPYPGMLPGVWPLVRAGVLLGGVSAAVLASWRRRPYLLFGWLWYLGTLVPVIGLVQAGDQAMADRFTYVPLIGLFVMAAWGLPELVGRVRASRVVLPAVAVVAIGFCAVLSFRQVLTWQNTETMWRHALAVNPGNPRANLGMSDVLARRGRVHEAVAYAAEAVQVIPQSAEYRNSYGLALQRTGDIAGAVTEFSQAVRLEPEFAAAHTNLGLALTQSGRLDQAIGHFKEALRVEPDLVGAHTDLGIALAAEGKVAEASAEYREALRLNDNVPEAHNNLAALLVGEGKIEEAIEHYRQALRIEPDGAKRHSNLAAAFALNGQVSDAIVELQSAVRLDPDLVQAHQNLAVLLIRQGDVESAEHELHEVLRVDPTNHQALEMLEAMLR